MTDPTPRAREEVDTVDFNDAEGFAFALAHGTGFVFTPEKMRNLARAYLALRAVPVLHRDLPAPAYSGGPVTDAIREAVAAMREQADALDENGRFFHGGAYYLRAAADALEQAGDDTREPFRYDQHDGGCWVACLAGLARLPQDTLRVPRADELTEAHWPAYSREIRRTLAAHGFLHFTTEFPGAPRIAPPGFAVEFGRSARGVLHAIIVRDGVLWHDPHPSREGLVTHAGYEVLVPVAAMRAQAQEGV